MDPRHTICQIFCHFVLLVLGSQKHVHLTLFVFLSKTSVTKSEMEAWTREWDPEAPKEVPLIDEAEKTYINPKKQRMIFTLFLLRVDLQDKMLLL